MLKNKTITNRIILLAIAGGIVGFIISSTRPFAVTITFTALGIAIGAITSSLALRSQFGAKDHTCDELNIKLREERLDITKDQVKTANVNVHKDIITDEHTISVPVTREDLVIEKKAVGRNKKSKIIRIPLSTEHIEVIKHPKPLNDVNVYKKKFTETETIEETIKKETLNIDSEGEAH